MLPPVPAAEVAPAEPAAAEPPGHNPLPRLRDPNVTLQAVAWSVHPERRMAVVNDQMVYKGSNVGGYAIVAIEENGVVVEQGGKRSLLTYGH